MIRRSTGLLAFLIALLSLPAAAYTGGGNATVMLLGSPSANCVAWPNCPTILNSAAAPLYTLDPTVNASIQSLLTALAAPLPLPTGASTSQLQTTANGYLANISGRVTGNLALDSSIQSLLAALQAPLTFNLPTNAATATNQATANGYLLTLATASASQATGAKQDTGNASLATIATNSGTQATAANQTRVQSAPGTPQTIALTIQGNAAGVPVLVSGTVTIIPSGTQTVAGTVGLSAGSAIIGKAGIDQTTPGTTNGVVVNSGSVTVSGSVTTTSGSTGLDYSANKPTLPNVGANFAASGPYASYVLIATVPASASRANVDIENLSGAQIAIIRDDGTASSGGAPANASIFSLSQGSGVGQQGGSWTSATFKGRLQIYAPTSSAQIAVMVD